MAQQKLSHPNGALYCDLMEYLKWRIESVGKTIDLVRTGKHYLNNRHAAEFCLLQLRFCCELLAIGCVAIHTDIPQTARLQKEWNASAIVKIFESLKADFFPMAIREETGSDGVVEHHPADGALTKPEFLKMYNLFGNLLHTGTFKRYKDAEKQTFDFKILSDFISKLVALLNNHVYFLEEKKMMIRVIMHNIKDGRVWFNELHAVERPQ